MLARILSLFKPRPVTAPQAPAVVKAPRVEGEGPATAPAVPPAAVQIVAEFEGFKATAYLCPAGVWTIGYGTTRWDNGAPVVRGDGPVTQEAARRMLRRDLDDAARALDRLVTVPLTEHQRAALISLIYNIGAGAFERSTLRAHLNAGRYVSAAGEFTRWNKGGGAVLPGLVRRRAAEVRLFTGQGGNIA